MSRWIEGTLDPYWEQGMEGSFLYNLNLPALDRPYMLEPGDLLDIFDRDQRLLWSGTFELRKRRFWERHRLGTGVFSGTVLQGLSYGQWMEWLWSKPRLKARTLRPDEKTQIVYAKTAGNQRPLRLRDAADRCLGRRVLEWSANQGTYGMGGPGFFGLLLESTPDYPEEWFTLTLWGATDWLLVDDRWLSAHPRYYEIQKPLTGNFGPDQTWDEFTALATNSIVEKSQVHPTHFSFVLRKNGDQTRIDLPEDTERLPKLGGVDQAREWNPEEETQDAWVFHQSTLYCP